MEIERLRDVVERAGLDGLDGAVHAGRVSRENDVRLGIGLFDLPQYVEAVFLTPPHIDYGSLRLDRGKESQRGGGVRPGDDGHAELDGEPLDHTEDERIFVHDEHRRHFTGGLAVQIDRFGGSTLYIDRPSPFCRTSRPPTSKSYTSAEERTMPKSFPS